MRSSDAWGKGCARKRPVTQNQVTPGPEMKEQSVFHHQKQPHALGGRTDPVDRNHERQENSVLDPQGDAKGGPSGRRRGPGRRKKVEKRRSGKRARPNNNNKGMRMRLAPTRQRGKAFIIPCRRLEEIEESGVPQLDKGGRLLDRAQRVSPMRKLLGREGA